MNNDFDVIILGGGMAGLTLALQIKQRNANISIAVLERRNGAAKHAAHKVGESTVELGTYYLRENLGLKDYLEKNHLHKHGLRFYFSPEVKETIDKRVEYGARNELFVPSHQIDRGIFENDLTEMNTQLGNEIKMGVLVHDVNLSDEGHTVYLTQEDTKQQLTCRWVVDATGRANLLKRKEGLSKEIPHNINAAWFRVEGEIDIEQWSDNESWKNYINPGLRRLGTVHFMDKGYWVWFIPLSSGNTSIGIVADPRFHDFSSFNKREKAFEWLEKNEPLCAKHLKDKKDKILDFRILKHYSYDTKLFYSTDNWGVVGEAGAFLDPFYSPGADFISLANSWMGDLILREYVGEDVYTRTIVYDKVHAQLFKNWIPIYQDKYELFGNSQVMSVKITWDFAVYWAIPTLIFTNEGFVNMNILKSLFTTLNSFGDRFAKLNKQVQDFFLDWGRLEDNSITDSYVDPMSVPFVADFQKGLENIYKTEEELINKLEENLLILEKMAAEIFRIVSARIKGTPEDLPVDPYLVSLNLSKEKLIDLGTSSSVHAFDKTMADAISTLWLKEKVML